MANIMERAIQVPLDYKTLPIELIADREAGKVPDCFLRSRHVDIVNGTERRLDEKVPVIDLKMYLSGDDASKAETRAKVEKACEDWGFFQVLGTT